MNLITQIVDWKKEQLHPNQKVVTVIRRTIDTTADGVIPYGVKAKPL